MSEPILIYVDGSCIGNPGKCGVAVMVIENDEERTYSKNVGHGTNNFAELMAVDYALDILGKTTKKIKVHCDSQYVIGVLSMNWTPKVNKELITAIKKRLTEYNIEFYKVLGHSDDRRNKIVDKLAYNSANEE